MSSITQTVPSYNGGISQQPDDLKSPGQLITAKNVLPDLTDGLQKRPGGKLIASISDYDGNITVPDGSNTDTVYDPDSQTNGRWFSYYRDETEQYVGQIAQDGQVRMWKCSDGSVVPVVYTGGSGSASETALKLYLNHKADDDLQTLTLNDYTYVTNRGTLKNDSSTHPKTDVAMSATVETVRPPEVFIDLKKISYASQYSLNLYDNTNLTTVTTATRIQVTRINDSSNGCQSDGSLSGAPDGGHRCTKAGGTETQDSFCPNVDTRIFAANYNAAGDSASKNGVSWTYSGSINGGTASDRKNLYFRIATIGQSVPEGGNTQNPDYRCRYTTTHDLLYGGEGWVTGDYINVWMKNAQYKVEITDHSTSKVQANLSLARPLPTPFDNETTITAESILGDLETEIIADGNFTDANIEQIGTGLYITRSSGSFNASSPVGDLLNVVSGSVNDVEDLPAQCKHGFVVEVKNSAAEEDNYFLKFFGENDRDGDGVWEECPKPGRKIEFDKETMPIQITRLQDDGSGTVTGTGSAIYFKVGYPDWENCGVGDSTTAAEPTFVGKKINKLVFFRNRLVLLSDENVIMSRPGSFFDFWPKSAITNSNIDPIDLSCSSTFPAIVYDAIQVNSGLVLFTKNQQFMLTTDSDILNPTTAKMNAIANYNFNYQTNPISLGVTLGWLDNAGKNTRFFEMARVMREGEPEVVEQSKVVANLFNKDLRLISVSRENSVIFFSEKNKTTLYGYRYFSSPEKRIQNAWFTWELSGNIQHHTVLDDSLFVVIRNGSKDVLQKFDIKVHDDSLTVTDDQDTTDTTDDIEYRIHLDNSKIITASQLGYSSTTGRTGFTKPDGFNNSSAQIVVFCHKADTSLPNPDPSTDAQDSDLIGAYSTASIIGNPGDYNIEWDGDWTDHDIIVGYLFDYEVKFPTIYYTQTTGEKTRALSQGSLVIHRLKLNLGDSGLYETLIERTGKPNYTETWEPAMTDAYNANQVQFTQTSTRTVPVYERNTNLVVTLKSSHPSPATLYSMTWEGDYTNRYYQRV